MVFLPKTFVAQNYLPSAERVHETLLENLNSIRSGGILEPPCPSVDAQLGKMVQFA